MSRYKGLMSGKLSLRCYNAQVGEIMEIVKAINKVVTLGMPVRS
uniref:Mobile element protein n=2 Tax=Vibrio TaxID=662 RepID=A0A0H4A347_9VIBR|nr:Mobile element protein [Vibrio splendidus]AKN40236.1 Mobile element protein [Vibrio tasmaniensis]